MVDTGATTAHNPIKTEFIETFNAIYNPPPPPLMPLTAGEGGTLEAEDDDLDIDAFDALPPLEDCFLPPDLLEGGALMEGGGGGMMGGGGGGGGGGEGGDDWDFGAAMDFIFDKEKEGGDGVPAPTTDSEWFATGGGGGGGNPPGGGGRGGGHGHGQQQQLPPALASGGGWSGGGVPGGGKMPAPSSSSWAAATAQAAQQQHGPGQGQGEEESPIKFMYEDALQRLRFEQFVKSFLSMSVFHTAECWVARGADTLEQVGVCLCVGVYECVRVRVRV